MQRSFEEVSIIKEHVIRQNEDLYQSTPNQYFNGEISNSDSNLAIIWTPQILRVIDLRGIKKEIKQVSYLENQGKKIHKATIQNDYLIIVIEQQNQQKNNKLIRLGGGGVVGEGQQSSFFVEIRKLKDTKGFECSRFQLPDPYAVISVKMMNDQQGGSEISLRFVFLREGNQLNLLQISNENTNLQKFLINQEDESTGELLKVQDIFIANRDEIAINCNNQQIVIISYDEAFNNLRLDQLKYSKYLKIDNPNDIYEVKGVDYYQGLSSPYIIVSKQSKDLDETHEIEVFSCKKYDNIQKLKNVQVLFSQQQQQYNEDEMINEESSRFIDEQNSPELTGSQIMFNKRRISRILDICSYNNQYSLLIQEGNNLIMLYLNEREEEDIEILQINKPFRIGNAQVIKDLLNCKIIKNQIIRNRTGVKAKIILLSKGGTFIQELSVQWKVDLMTEYLVSLQKRQIQEILQDEGKIKNICKEIIPDIYSRFDYNQDALIYTLLQSEQYRKLADFILMRDDRGNKSIFEAMGNLRNFIDQELEIIKKEELITVLTSISCLQKIPFEAQNSISFIEFKQKIKHQISHLQIKLDGLIIIMNAVNKRQSEQAAFNKIIAGANSIRESEKEEISNLQRRIVENVEKLYNFLKVLDFMVFSGFLQFSYQYKYQMKDLYQKRYNQFESNTQQLLLLHQLLSFAPHLKQSIPLINLEDFISLIDESPFIIKSLAIIYYQTLDLYSLSNITNEQTQALKRNFQIQLSSLFNQSLQDQVEAIWNIDELLIPSNLNNKESDFKMRMKTMNAVNTLLGNKTLIEILEKELLQKLLQYQQEEACLLIVGAFSNKSKQTTLDLASLIVDVYISLNQTKKALQFLLTIEDYADSQEYKMLFIKILKNVLERREVQEVFFNTPLSDQQDQLLLKLLQEGDSPLLEKSEDMENIAIQYLLWKREIVNAVGYANKLKMNTPQKQSSENKYPTSNLLSSKSMNDQKREQLINIYFSQFSQDQKIASYEQCNMQKSDIEFELMLQKSEKQSESKMKQVLLMNNQQQQQQNQQQQQAKEFQQQEKFGDKISIKSRGYQEKALQNSFLSDPFFSQQQNKKQEKVKTLTDFYFEESKIQKEKQQFQPISSNNYNSFQRKGLGIENKLTSEYKIKEGLNGIGFSQKYSVYDPTTKLNDQQLYNNLMDQINKERDEELLRSKKRGEGRGRDSKQRNSSEMFDVMSNRKSNSQLIHSQLDSQYQQQQQQQDIQFNKSSLLFEQNTQSLQDIQDSNISAGELAGQRIDTNLILDENDLPASPFRDNLHLQEQNNEDMEQQDQEDYVEDYGQQQYLKFSGTTNTAVSANIMTQSQQQTQNQANLIPQNAMNQRSFLQKSQLSVVNESNREYMQSNEDDQSDIKGSVQSQKNKKQQEEDFRATTSFEQEVIRPSSSLGFVYSDQEEDEDNEKGRSGSGSKRDSKNLRMKQITAQVKQHPNYETIVQENELTRSKAKEKGLDSEGLLKIPNKQQEQ